MNTPQMGDAIQTQILDHYESYGSSEQHRTVAELRQDISAAIRRDFSDPVRAEQEINDILTALAILTALGNEVDTIEHRHPDADVTTLERRMDDLWDEISKSLSTLVMLIQTPKAVA